jgi:hypothetical protein
LSEKLTAGGVAPGVVAAVVAGFAPGGGKLAAGVPSTWSFMHSPFVARLNCPQFHSAFS